MNLQKILRPVVFGLLFLVPIFPLIVANSLFFPFITGKAFFFRIVVELAFSGWIILAFLDAKYRPKFTPLTLAVTLFTVVTLIADLLGVNVLRSIWSNFERMEGWLVIVHLWAFFMTIVHMFGTDAEGRRWWHRWIHMSFFVAYIVAGYGIVQLMGGAAIHQGSTRIDASLGNAAYMAIYMLIHAFIAAYLFFVSRTEKFRKGNSPAVRWIYFISFFLFSFEVFETATRGTILALVGGVILSLLIHAIFSKKESAKNRMISAGVIAVIILVGAVFWVNRNTPFVQNHEVLNRLANISISEAKTQARGYIWPMALKGFTERPIFGWGQENFNYIFNANYNPKMWSQEQWFDRAHSVYLDWLTASGAVGLLTYLSLYVLAFVGIWKSSLGIREKSVLTGLVAAYAVHNVFVFDNLASYVLFFAVLGFVNSFKEGKHIRWLGKSPVRQDAVEYIVAPIVLVLFVVTIYTLNIRPLEANTRLIAALQGCASNQPDAAKFEQALVLNQYIANQEIREQVLSCSQNVLSNQYPGPIQKSFITLASEQIDKQVAITPNDARIYTIAGSFYNSVGQVELAKPLLEKATTLSPGKQSIELQLVNVYVNENKNDEALALLEKMYQAAPEHPGVRDVYARVLILAGKEADAKQIFKDDPSVLESVGVAQVYVSLKKYPQAVALYEKLIAADPKNVQVRSQFIQALAIAGMRVRAIAELRKVETDFPDLKAQAEAIIKQLQTTP